MSIVENSIINACRCQNWAELTGLLRPGLNLNLTDNSGRTALMWACMRGNTGAAKLLIENGANVNAEQEALKNADDLRQINGMWTALMYASRYSHLETVTYLLKAGADANARNKKGDTALLWSVRFGDASATFSLIKFGGADVHEPDEKGITPLMEAVRARKYAYLNPHCKVLLEAGASFDDVDKSGKTALDYAYDKDKAEDWFKEIRRSVEGDFVMK